MAFHESSRTAPGPSAQPFPGSSGISAPIDLPTAENEEEMEGGPENEGPLVAEEKWGDDKDRLVRWIDNFNIARHLDRMTLDAIGTQVVREYELDEQSRAEWKDQAECALKFATQKAEPKQYPWADAANVIFPLLTTAAFQFSAIAYPALIEDRNIARGITWGDDDGTPTTQDGKPGGPPVMDGNGQIVWLIKPGEKQIRADRIGQHMSWQLLEKMEEWEPQTDTGLVQEAIVGGFVRKTFHNPATDENESVLVPLMKLVWNMHAPSFEKAPRHTELLQFYPHEVTEFERQDYTFLPIVYGVGDHAEDGQMESSDPQAPYQFLEQHTRFDLDGDGYAEPLIITVHHRTAKVVRIVARYDADGIQETEFEGEQIISRIAAADCYTLYPFLPNPDGGSYPVGFGHLLKPLNEAINTSLNMMLDAGHLQIAGGGFIGTSLSISSGTVNFQMGEYKPVNNKGQSIRDAVFPLPFPGPSPVLFQLLGFLVQAAKEVASIQNILAGDPSLANVQPTTLLALIEQGMRLYTAIHKRTYRALKKELNKLYRLNRIYLTKGERYRVGQETFQVTPDDYRLGGGVDPAADPNMVTDMQKLSRALVVFQLKDDPLVNPIEVRRRLLEAARVERIDKVLLQAPPPPPPQAQMEMATAQAELGRTRAAEVKDQTQGILNLAQAQKLANESQIVWIEQQIDAMRVRLEALNTTIKAAHVDAEFHGHNTRMKQSGDEARETSHAAGQASTVQPPAPQPVSGPVGAGLSAMAPPPGNGAVPPVPAPSSGLLPPPAPPGLGGGGPQ